MSAAQSTSMPSFLMVSERRSRLVRELSTSSTRFFLGVAKAGSLGGKIVEERLTPRPLSSGKQRLSVWRPDSHFEVVRDCARDARFQPCVFCEIWPYHR